MTAARLAVLADEARALEAEINRLGAPGAIAGADTRRELEQRVLRLCADAQALPPADARSLMDALATLVDAFDAAAERLRAAGARADDSPTPAADPRRAAAAYGAAAGRRRGGF